MIQTIEVKIFPDKINDQDFINGKIIQLLKTKTSHIRDIILIKKSIDARGKRPIFILKYDVYLDENYHAPNSIVQTYPNVEQRQTVIIIGAGPAGYFAALELIELGLKPVILERGKDVRERRKDLKDIQQDGIVNPDSNYCFGEGGAGTYSDGKLYTRSNKRGSINKVLQLLVEHGATQDILTDAHPHIGSNKLPNIMEAIRKTIEKCGGKVLFDHRVNDLVIDDNQMKGVLCDGKFFSSSKVILATGHSARDIYRLLNKKGIMIEAKPFALGLRIEHAQSYIDKVQYHQSPREDNLPASSYAVVSQVDGQGVFSFCMCPGGLIVPAATSPGEIVVNGMSLSRRDSPYANSGFVTSIGIEELAKHGYSGVFACLNFQKDVEQKMFSVGSGSQMAPAQRVEDFVNGVRSPVLNPSSYIPGLISAPLHEILPNFVYQRLRKGLADINKKMKGYITNNANIVGVESRTSAPIKIPRDNNTCEHLNIKGLYPCGEGAGYAGGIISAAMDGQKVAIAIATN
jgi:uncharacterized FAD-dependent dehydrogenase